MSTQPDTSAKMINAAALIVRQLETQGIDHLFCVPGESFLAVLDALVDSSIKVTVCRNEAGAAMMAEAHGKLTGRPAACFVTRGPGATNAAHGVHIAHHDSTPMLICIGQVARHVRGRGAFQELDYRSVFGSMTKWVTEVEEADRIPEILSRAFYLSMSGRPGPVVISLPEDMLRDPASAVPAPRVEPVPAYPGAEQMRELETRMARAERPIAILGGPRWTAEAVSGFAQWAKGWSLPVAVSFRRQMLFPADHPCFIGDLGLGANPRLAAHVRDADLVLLVGGRLPEVPSQNYTLLDVPSPRQELVHVYPDSAELGRVYRPHLAIRADPDHFAAALVPRADPQPRASLAKAREDYLAWSDPRQITHAGKLQMPQIIRWLGENLPPDAILCNGAGNYATWLHRFFPFRLFGTQLAPTSGSMGYGVPAAVAAKRICPGRTVVAFAGDGCFLMNGQEFATAVQYDLPIIVIVIDNGMYGTIRMHQEREHPGRVIATSLRNPDFAAYARSFGGHGERVETTGQFAPAFQRARESGLPAIIHCLLDPEAITPDATLSQIRESALARHRS